MSNDTDFISRYIFIIIVFFGMMGYLFDLYEESIMLPIVLTSLGAHFILEGLFYSKSNITKLFIILFGLNFVVVVFVKFILV